MKETSVVSGTRRGIKELVDGTIRVSVDIDPRFRRAFFELFPDIDAPVALAPLVESFEQPSPASDRVVTEAAAESVKGGQLSKTAAMMCADPKFQEWLATMNRGLCSKLNGGGSAVNQDGAARLVRAICGVNSRAELDHDTKAAHLFHEQIRKPFNRYCQGEAGNCA